MLAGAVSI